MATGKGGGSRLFGGVSLKDVAAQVRDRGEGSPLDKSAPDVKTTGIVLKNLITDYGVLPPVILEASLPPTK